MSQYEDDRSINDELNTECTAPLTIAEKAIYGQQQNDHAAYTLRMIAEQENQQPLSN